MKQHFKAHFTCIAIGLASFVWPIQALAQTNHHQSDGNLLGDTCMGSGCSALTDYDNKILTLRATSPEILFDAAPLLSSFPDNDWQIEINDPVINGMDFFAIRDVTNNRVLFKLEPSIGVKSNPFYMTDRGKIGLGTNAPITDLHILDNTTPSFRLEQESASFGDFAYEMTVNDDGFILSNKFNDADNVVGDKLIIENNVRRNAIVLADSNRTGFGIDDPQESIHVVGNAGESTSFMLENVGNNNAGDGRWEFVMRRADGEFAINDADTPGGDFIFTGPSDQVNGSTAISIFNPTRGARWDMETRGSDGDFAIDDRRTSGAADFIFRSSITNDPDGAGLFINGKVVTTGSCSMGCDAVFDADYDLPSIEEHAAEMFEKKHLPTVGPTESGQIDVTQKMLTMLNELEKAHIYIAELNEEKKALAVRLEALEAKVGQ